MTDFRAVARRGLNNRCPLARASRATASYSQSPGATQRVRGRTTTSSRYLDLKYSDDRCSGTTARASSEHEFAEGYLEFEMFDSQLFARLGKLIVVWGKTELFRNQDRNNPLDIGNGIFAPLDEARVGQWALDVTLSPEAFMRVGPVEDLRLELLTILNQFDADRPRQVRRGCVRRADLPEELRRDGQRPRGPRRASARRGRRRTTTASRPTTTARASRAASTASRSRSPTSGAGTTASSSTWCSSTSAPRTSATGAPLAIDQSRQHGGHARSARTPRVSPSVRTASPATATTTSRAPATACSGTSPDDDPDAPQHLRSARRGRRAAAGQPDPVPLDLRLHLRPGRGLLRLRPPEQPRHVRLHLRASSAASAASAASSSTAPRRSTSMAARSDTSRRREQLAERLPGASSSWPSNPKGVQDQTAQDLGLNLQPEQSALLGCGPAVRLAVQQAAGASVGCGPGDRERT